MTAVGGSDSSLAAKCLDLCQVLAGQGLAFNFSLSIGSAFSFSLDARGKGQALATQGKTKKKKNLPKKCQKKNRVFEEKTGSFWRAQGPHLWECSRAQKRRFWRSFQV